MTFFTPELRLNQDIKFPQKLQLWCVRGADIIVKGLYFDSMTLFSFLE